MRITDLAVLQYLGIVTADTSGIINHFYLFINSPSTKFTHSCPHHIRAGFSRKNAKYRIYAFTFKYHLLKPKTLDQKQSSWDTNPCQCVMLAPQMEVCILALWHRHLEWLVCLRHSVYILIAMVLLLGFTDFIHSLKPNYPSGL